MATRAPSRRSETLPAAASIDRPATTARPSAGRAKRARWLIGVLAVGILLALYPFVPGFFGAAMLAVIAIPVHRRLAPRLGVRVSALLATAATLVLVLAPLLLVGASLVAQSPAALHRVAESTLYHRLSTLVIGPVDVGAVIAEAGSAVIDWGSRQALAVAGGITRATLNLLIALFGLYYLLVGGSGLWERSRRYLPFREGTAELLRMRFRDVTEAMVLGVLATALVQGVVVGIGFAVVNLPGAAFWGMVTACVSVLPILGSSLVWLPGTAVLLLQQRYGAAMALFLIGLIVASNLDNVVRPIVYRRVSNVHPMITLVGAFAGVRLFGIAGLLVGPLAILYLLELLRAYEVEFGSGASAAAPGPAAPPGEERPPA